MKNKLTSILGSTLACALVEVVGNLIVHGATTHLVPPAIVGLILGAIVGGIIAVCGSDRPLVIGLVATTLLCGGIIAFLTSMSVTVITTDFDLLMVAVTVGLLGLSNGFGFRLLGPSRA